MPIELTKEVFELTGWDKINEITAANQPERNAKQIEVLEDELKTVSFSPEGKKSLEGDVKKLKETGLTSKEAGLDIDFGNMATDSISSSLTPELRSFLGMPTAKSTQLEDNPINIEAIKTKEEPFKIQTKEEKLSAEMTHKPFHPIESYRGLDPMTDLALDMRERFVNPKSSFEKFAKQLKEEPEKLFVDSFGGAGIIKSAYKGVFTQKALDSALDLVKANPNTHTFVNINPRMFLDVAYPIKKTSEDLAKAMPKPPSELDIANMYLSRKDAVDKYISEGGVNEVLYLRMKGGQIDWHEGRTRALAALARGLDKVPVVIIDETGSFAKGSPYYKHTISEHGSKMVPTKELAKDVIKE